MRTESIPGVVAHEYTSARATNDRRVHYDDGFIPATIAARFTTRSSPRPRRRSGFIFDFYYAVAAAITRLRRPNKTRRINSPTTTFERG